MKLIPKLVVALAALGACAAASAQTTGRADQERRDRNRQEAMANWERTQKGAADRASTRNRGGDVRNTRARTSDPTRRDLREDAQTVRSKTRQAAQATQSFTQRQAENVRNFGERQQRKLPAGTNRRTSNKSDTALGK